MHDRSTISIADVVGPSLSGRLLLGGFVLLTILAFLNFDLTTYLSLDAIKMLRDRLLQFTDRYYCGISRGPIRAPVMGAT